MMYTAGGKHSEEGKVGGGGGRSLACLGTLIRAEGNREKVS